MAGSTMFNPSVTILSRQPAVLSQPDLSLPAVLDRFPALEAASAICISGSAAQGWANSYSDVDLYAFAESRLDLPVDDSMETWETNDPSGIRWTNWMGRYGDTRVDLKVLSAEMPRRALEPFLGEDEPEFCEVGTVVEEFVYRLSIARPVSGEELVAEIQALIARSSFRRSLARTQKLHAENRLTDVAGQLEAGDVLGARIAALEAAGFAADCCLVAAGDLCRSTKWLLRRLEKTPAAGISADEYLSEILQGPRDGESTAECAARIARWAQAQLIRVEPAVMVTNQG